MYSTLHKQKYLYGEPRFDHIFDRVDRLVILGSQEESPKKWEAVYEGWKFNNATLPRKQDSHARQDMSARDRPLRGQVSGREQGSLVAGLCQGQVSARDRSVAGDRAVR
jgi:hypothetical protein